MHSVKMTQDKRTNPEKKTWCNRWTNVEIVLAVVVIGLTAIIIHMLIATPDPIDLTISCGKLAHLKSAIEIQDFIDPSIDPCEDFHHFVCGNFFKNSYKQQVPAPTFGEWKQLQNELKSYIVEPISEEDSQPVKAQKQFFRACLDLEEIDADQDNTFLQLMEEIGGWPVLKGNAWQEEKFDWVNVMVTCRQLGLPFDWFLEFEIHRGEEIQLKISHPLINSEMNSYMIDVIVNLSGSKSDAQSAMEDVADFQKALANVTQQEFKMQTVTVGDLQNFSPKINWPEVLKSVTEREWDVDEEIVTNIKDYILKVDHVFARTKKRTQANYIVCKIVEEFAPFLSDSIRAVYANQTLNSQSRVDFCVDQTALRFPFLPETEYIRKYAKPEVRESVHNLSSFVQEEFISRVETQQWWNETSRAKYLQKFKETVFEIGGPEKIFDEVFFDNWYLHIGNLSFSSDKPSILELLTVRENSYYNSIFGIIGQNNTDPQRMYPTFIGLYYDEESNRLILPAPILHGFLYDLERPQYLNFASLGSLIAAKFIESLYILTKNDENANDVAEFEASMKCFEDDYSNITTNEKFIANGTEVVEVAVFDIIGRDIAYQAWQTWAKDKEDEISNVPYTPRQLFWIKSSFISCHKQLIDNEEVSDFGEVISEYKNILSGRHSRYFGEDFGCAANTMMHPDNKC